MKIYRYTGESIYWYSGSSELELKENELLREGDDRLKVTPDHKTGPEPFEHVDDLPEVGDVTDLKQLQLAAKEIRDFIRDGNYTLLEWVKPAVDKLWRIALDQFDSDLIPPPAWYGLDKDQIKLWLTKLINWTTEELAHVDPLPVTSGVSEGRSNEVIELLADSMTLEMREIVTSPKFPSADKKMRELCRIDSRFLGWDSPRWAKLLGISDPAIRKTKFWTEDRPRMIGDD